MISNSDQTSRDIGVALQGYLSAVGIDVTLDPADATRYVDTGNNGWKEGFWYGGIRYQSRLKLCPIYCLQFPAHCQYQAY